MWYHIGVCGNISAMHLTNTFKSLRQILRLSGKVKCGMTRAEKSRKEPKGANDTSHMLRHISDEHVILQIFFHIWLGVFDGFIHDSVSFPPIHTN